MHAVQYREVGQPPRVVDVDVPTPGPGQILLRVTAAGICHSDLTVMHWDAKTLPYQLPLTLGHEGAGVVEAVGENVNAVSVGDSVVVYGPWGCGTCHACSQGRENYCPRAARLGIMPPGLGRPGALAEYLLVDSERHVVPIGDLDPVKTVPLTDAGLTPYHAIKRSMSKLEPGSVAVVIGAGGLGHVGIQLLRLMSAATVVALDIREESRELALRSGAHHALPSDSKAVGLVRELTDGAGADVVFDFVGAQVTLDLAAQMAGLDSHINIIGIGGGSLPVSFDSLPYGTRVSTSYWGTRSELIELVELAKQGAIDVHVERYELEEGPEVYKRMEAGKIQGRAVLVPAQRS
ncbi:NAD(P)-dependent alcohol dehydrogenase [Thermobifida fusca]|jgi:propanol-preferring alcohol dehydrogenase|uniref:alcohol dehydrogenase n=2 Tax=Thermobifida fusca TaxID=2021 RepID=A0A9P2WPM7_THEFU|nr:MULTISPECIES: NAD(P)-dependent alcohol dehydrogenase [Thermobifida]AAZ56804.1 putative dehydrogenase [Thermobifida fusca YX]EOR70234.1 dehydrogenase [Thermobifida fusca TM51]MBO2528883.1 NAD(P)-dependent alcohol dehydrogenase [Thermobifida sp.]MDD6791696.1 NAD(P)-dependent alcohol dehydrogenase [Thermobifida fusca]PPS95226.1 alcohol dehydrogenase [Thermobifida fusca]